MHVMCRSIRMDLGVYVNVQLRYEVMVSTICTTCGCGVHLSLHIRLGNACWNQSRRILHSHLQS